MNLLIELIMESKKIAKTYREVFDTEPQCNIQDEINKEYEAQGWKPVSRWDW